MEHFTSIYFGLCQKTHLLAVTVNDIKSFHEHLFSLLFSNITQQWNITASFTNFPFDFRATEFGRYLKRCFLWHRSSLLKEKTAVLFWFLLNPLSPCHHKACLISWCKRSPAIERRSQAVKRQQHADETWFCSS